MSDWAYNRLRERVENFAKELLVRDQHGFNPRDTGPRTSAEVGAALLAVLVEAVPPEPDDFGYGPWKGKSMKWFEAVMMECHNTGDVRQAIVNVEARGVTVDD